MCAILILGVALVGLTQGLTTALRASKDSEQQTAAALIAAGQVELLRAEGYLVAEESAGESGTGAGAYRWKQSVSTTRIEGLHEVRVVVESGNPGVAIYELRTLLFDPPTISDSTSRARGRQVSNNLNRGTP
jgi:hypothetical protein